MIAELRPVTELRPLVDFTVRGLPAPQGSKRAFRNKYTGRIQQVESSKAVGPWRTAIRTRAEIAMGDRPVFRGPVLVVMSFTFPRPKSHFGVHGNLLPSAPAYPEGRPDLDKLQRAVYDACKGVIWHDDSQIVDNANRKRWGEAPGCRIGILYPGDELLAFDWAVRPTDA